MDSRYKWFIFLFLSLLYRALPGQDISLGLTDFLGTGRSNDLGMELSYSHPAGRHFIQAGVELRSIDWGNLLGLQFGYRTAYVNKRKWTFGSTSYFHPGISLFRRDQLMNYGISHMPFIRWQVKNRAFLQMETGIRYNICPGYKKYGHYTQLEFPLKLQWGWRLGKMKSSGDTARL